MIHFYVKLHSWWSLQIHHYCVSVVVDTFLCKPYSWWSLIVFSWWNWKGGIMIFCSQAQKPFWASAERQWLLWQNRSYWKQYTLMKPIVLGSCKYPFFFYNDRILETNHIMHVSLCLVSPRSSSVLFKYSRTSVARTPMARLPWMSRTRSWVRRDFLQILLLSCKCMLCVLISIAPMRRF